MSTMAESAPAAADFFKIKHVKYFQRCLQVIPSQYASFDTTRLTVAFFAISGLDLLQSLDVISDEKEQIIDWIYSMQVLPCSDGSNANRCGFRGSSTITLTNKETEKCSIEAIPYDCGHLAMTYTGLASLVILGDDLSRVDKNAIVEGLRDLQLPTGSYAAVIDGSENDMRFVFCAAAVCYILQDWRGMNIPATLKYIRNSISYDQGIGQGLYSESHGGLTYCAIATLTLLNSLDSTINSQEIKRLCRWCLFRQQSGFQGRPNKPQDTCYSFWVGATLKLLGTFHLIDFGQNREFILSTQNGVIGGLAKYPNHTPDPLHTYCGLGGLALMGEKGLREINPALNISAKASDHLHRLHEGWMSCLPTS